MEYLEAVDLVKEIENKYNVQRIKYKGVPVWANIRLYLCMDDVGPVIGVSSSSVKMGLKGLFAFNPFTWFGKYSIWSFTGLERRKRIGEKQVARISAGISIAEPKTLTIEKSVFSPHYKKRQINEKNIQSEAFLLGLSRFLRIFTRIRSKEIEGFDIIERIINDYGLKCDYVSHLKLMIAQKRAVDFLLLITHKPKIVFIECPYPIMGYVWSFKNHRIRVVEMQHGVLNSHHYAYNGQYRNETLLPDAICVYGEREYDYFKHSQINYTPLVYKSGLYILESADKYFKEDILKEFRDKYDKIMVFAGQQGREEELFKYCEGLAKEHKEYLCIYIPRHDDVTFTTLEDNVILKTGVNIYQYLKWCDIHATISSTTCLEAHYFHKPTVFIDLDNLATEYYGGFLKEENGVKYIKDLSEFGRACAELSDGKFLYKELFYHDNVKNLKEIIRNEIRLISSETK